MAISGKNYTIDARQLLTMSVSDRTSMINNRTFREEILRALTPVQLAQVFPQYFKQGSYTSAGGGGMGASALSSYLSGGSSAEGGVAQTAVPLTSSLPGMSLPPPTSNAPPEKAGWFKKYMNIQSKTPSTGALPSAPRVSGGGNPLSTQRMRASGQLNQEQKIHMYALTMAEVGRTNPAAQRALMETIYNRYTAQKKASLSSTMQANYYEPLRPGTKGYQNYLKARADLMNNPDLFKQMDQRHNEVLAGSNDSNYSTQNGSAHVAASARRTQTIGAELGGETFSRKDNPAYAKLHGTGTVRNEGDWYKSTVAEMQSYEAGKMLAVPAEATEPTTGTQGQTGDIYPETDAQGRPTLGPGTSAGGPATPLPAEAYGVGKIGGQSKFSAEQQVKRGSAISGNIGFKGFGDKELEALSIPAGSGGWGRGSVPLGTYQLSRQQLGSRIAGYYQKHGVPTSGSYGTVYNIGLPGAPTSTGLDPRTGTSRVGIQIHANHSNDINKLFSEGCLTPTRDQFPQLQSAIERAFQISGSSNLVLQVDQDANGNPTFSIMPPTAGGAVASNAISVNEAVKNFKKTGNIASEKIELHPELQDKIKNLDPALQKEINAMNDADRNDLFKKMNSEFAQGVNPIDNINTLYKEQPAAAVQAITNAPPGQGPKETVTPDVEAAQTIQKAAEGKIPPTSKAVDEALKMKGLNERRDREQIKMFLDKSKRTSVDPANVPWCSSFVNAAMEGSGIKGTGSAMARSWLNWGEGVKDPRDVKKGDVVATMKHVAIATGSAYQDKNGRWIVPTVGGNQSLRGERGIEWVSETPRNFSGVSVRRARPEDYYEVPQTATQVVQQSPEPTELGPRESAGGPQQITSQPTALPAPEAPRFDINADPLEGVDRGRVPLNAFDNLNAEERQSLRVQFATNPDAAKAFVENYDKKARIFGMPIEATPDQIAGKIRESDQYKQHFSQPADVRQQIISGGVEKMNQQLQQQVQQQAPSEAPATSSAPADSSNVPEMKVGGETHLQDSVKVSAKITQQEAATGAVKVDGSRMIVNRPDVADQKIRVGDLEARRDVKQAQSSPENSPDAVNVLENKATMSVGTVPQKTYSYARMENFGDDKQSPSQENAFSQARFNKRQFAGLGTRPSNTVT